MQNWADVALFYLSLFFILLIFSSSINTIKDEMLDCMDWRGSPWEKISDWLVGTSCSQASFGLRKRDHSGLDSKVDVGVSVRREGARRLCLQLGGGME